LVTGPSGWVSTVRNAIGEIAPGGLLVDGADFSVRRSGDLLSVSVEFPVRLRGVFAVRSHRGQQNLLKERSSQRRR
jgi:hypothetical protein